MSKQRLEGGRELILGPKSGTAKQPLITIITSTFNAEKELPWTIKSIRSQNYPNIQWIVADGSSTDSTLDLLKANDDIIDYWFSESDKGIYDAWNKALRHVKGEWVQFLGAGDELASPDVLLKIAENIYNAHPKYDLAYGNLQFITEISRSPIEIRALSWDKMKEKWFFFRPCLPIHPEVFHHKSVFKEAESFPTHYKIAGDSFFLLKCIKEKEPLYIDILVDLMPIGGISATPKNIKNTANEIKLITKKLNIKVPFSHVLYENFKLYFKVFLYRLGGDKSFSFIANLIRKAQNKSKKWE